MPARPRKGGNRSVSPVEASGRHRPRQNDQRCPMSLQVRTKIWLERDGAFVIGEGGLHLLAAIDTLGSLLAAARQIGWSYRHAWNYLRGAEHILGSPLVVPRPGKGMRRGTVLTPEGRRLLELLVEMRSRVDRTAGVSGPTSQEIAARGSLQPSPRRANRRPVPEGRSTSRPIRDDRSRKPKKMIRQGDRFGHAAPRR
jgi:molybdate transport system regulatory protein